MARTAVVLTTFNRKTLVADAIASVYGQTDPDWHLYIMDDHSAPEHAARIAEMVERHEEASGLPYERGYVANPPPNTESIYFMGRTTVWRGHDPGNRKALIRYSVTINHALNHLLGNERYIAYLVDDDYFYPESIGPRADFLDAHPDVHVITGRQRSIQYDAAGFNRWQQVAAPQAGMAFPRPTGRRVLMHGGCAARTYFADPHERDPQTGLPYVEEAAWVLGESRYGQPCRHDHNSVMHRRECLTVCCRSEWYDTAALGGVQYWGEDPRHGVGDAAFLTLLGATHPFYGLDCWVASKRYHRFSDGVVSGEVRE